MNETITVSDNGEFSHQFLTGRLMPNIMQTSDSCPLWQVSEGTKPAPVPEVLRALIRAANNGLLISDVDDFLGELEKSLEAGEKLNAA